MAKKKDTELAVKAEETTALSGQVYDYGDMANDGWENTDQSDFTIPFLALLQSNSPQVEESDPNYIDGAVKGMMMNTATKQLFDGKKGVTFVPCLTQHVFVEWKNRELDGGGFIAIHECDSDVVKKAVSESTEFGKYKVPMAEGHDHDLVETFYIYGMLVDVDAKEIISPCMVAFTSTKIKVYKGVTSMLRQIKGRPPLYAFQLQITTVPDKNAKGPFHNFKIEPANGDAVSSLMPPDHPFLLAAKEFKDQISQGMVKIDHGGQNTGNSSGKNDDVPF
jgi:hypothetical protein